MAMCSSSSCFWVIPMRRGRMGTPDRKKAGQAEPVRPKIFPLGKCLNALTRGAPLARCEVTRGNLQRDQSSGLTMAMCSSSSCFCVTSLGALIITSWAFLFMGKGMISRMESSPASSITMRSTPGAMPA